MNTGTPPQSPEKPGGRPTVRTPEAAARILQAVSIGAPLVHAARAAKICYATLAAWRNEDPEFKERLEHAISLCVEKRLKTIQDAADAGDWRASEAWLRLVLPQEFSRSRLEITGSDGAPLTAGLQLYLPKKELPTIEAGDPVEVPALADRSGNGNGD